VAGPLALPPFQGFRFVDPFDDGGVQAGEDVADLGGPGTHSGSGNCIETAPVPDSIAVRDSAAPCAPALVFTLCAWTTFTAILKN
jgi:Domain of unknown function (DUF397)